MVKRISKNGKKYVYVFLIVILVMLNILSVSGQAQNITAFVNVNVVPMDEERVLERHTVLIVSDRIEQICPMEEVHVPAAAHVIEGEGSYLMPGLADMHMYLSYNSDP